ncbi:hypothetical protein D6810_00970, partial [Candidatus Dojkabacteria bacterium]
VFILLVSGLVVVFLIFNIIRYQTQLNRDREREISAKAIYTKIIEFRNKNGVLPEYIDLRFKVKLQNEVVEDIKLTKDRRFNPNDSIKSTEIGSIYCYKKFGNEFAFGVKYEASGSWLDLGDYRCQDDYVPNNFEVLR